MTEENIIKKYKVFSADNKLSFSLEFFSDIKDPEALREKARQVANDFCNALNKLPGVYISFYGIDEVTNENNELIHS